MQYSYSDYMRSIVREKRPLAEAISRVIALYAARLGEPRVLLDIGTGNGELLGQLCPIVDLAIGVDSNSEMVEVARARLDTSPIVAALVLENWRQVYVPDANILVASHSMYGETSWDSVIDQFASGRVKVTVAVVCLRDTREGYGEILRNIWLEVTGKDLPETYDADRLEEIVRQRSKCNGSERICIKHEIGEDIVEEYVRRTVQRLACNISKQEGEALANGILEQIKTENERCRIIAVTRIVWFLLGG